MTTSILITGATGTSGSALVNAITAKGLSFRTGSSKADQADSRKVLVDFSRPDTLKTAFTDIQTLYLLLPFAPDFVAYGRAAIDAAKAVGVKHIVRSSGAGADAASSFSLARAHGEVDAYLKASGLNWTILRPAVFMQNQINSNAAQIKAGEVHAPHGNGAISVIDVRDIADVAAVVLANPAQHQDQAYDLSGPEALTDTQQLEILSHALGHAIRYIDVPESAAVAGMTQAGMPSVLIGWLMSLNAEIKAGSAAKISDTVQKLTGKLPRRFAEFVRENISVWR